MEKISKITGLKRHQVWQTLLPTIMVLFVVWAVVTFGVPQN